MSWFHKIAAVEYMFHGTTSTNASTILSQGLNYQHPKTWGKSRRFTESYEGIYFTNKLNLARESASSAMHEHSKRNKKQETRQGSLYVMAQIEKRSPQVIIDEDQIRPSCNSCIGYINGMSDEQRIKQWIEDDFRDIDECAKQQIDRFFDRFQTEEMQKKDIKIEKLVPYMKDAIIADAFYEINNDLQGYRNANDVLLKKINYIINLDWADDWHGLAVRITEPITYRGKNRIVLVAQVPQFVDETIQILYAENQNVIDYFMQQTNKQWGTKQNYELSPYVKMKAASYELV